MTPETLTKMFTNPRGEFLLARWGRPLAPVVFGLEDQTLALMKEALVGVTALARLEIVETDPELGANLMVFFIRDWAELRRVPKMGEMLGDVDALVARLEAAQASRYHTFRFDEADAIKACFVFICVGDEMLEMPADELAMVQAVQVMLSWAQGAFAEIPALVRLPGGQVVLHPEIAALIEAAYDPLLPAMSRDPAAVLRVFARMEVKT